MTRNTPSHTTNEPYNCSFCGNPVDPDEHGDYDTLGSVRIHAQCEADRAWASREDIPTTAGIFKMAIVTTTKKVGGSDKILESYWQADCPVCQQTHSTDTHTEDARRELIDTVTDCCDTEFVWPTDYIHDCDICGESHRERHGCTAVASRDPMPALDQKFTCTDCEWTDNGNELSGPNGSCPECDSRAITIATNDFKNDAQ